MFSLTSIIPSTIEDESEPKELTYALPKIHKIEIYACKEDQPASTHKMVSKWVDLKPDTRSVRP